MNDNNRTVIKTIDEDGKELKLDIKSPGHKVLQEAQMVYNIELTSLIRSSIANDFQLFSREQLEKHLGDLGIWTEKDARLFLQLQIELRASELKLKQGGIKVSEAKNIAIQMKTKRAALLALYNRRSQFDSITMESIADNKKFRFLVTKCVVVSGSNIPFFTNINDYEKRQNEKASIDVATSLANKLYGYNDNIVSNLIENKWLQEFSFADNEGRLINKDGKLIDIDGRLVDEDGRFVNEQGKFVDYEGRLIDVDGNFVVDKPKPFIDDIKTKTTTKIKTKKKTRTKKK